MYEQKFKHVESTLRPRTKFTHNEAVGLLTTVVKDADVHIQGLNNAIDGKNMIIDQLEEENLVYKNWLLISTVVIVLLGLAHLL